jgi:hypothetical protein
MADNTILNTMSGGDTIASDDIGGVKFQRIKIIAGADGVNDGDISKTNPLPVLAIDTDRTVIAFWANGAAAGTTGTETAITLTKSAAPGSATTTATSFVVTNGKRFRITSISFATRGNATATTQVTVFSLRVNTAGAVTTTSNVMFSARSATPATSSAYDRTAVYTFTDAGPEIPGDGTLQFGMTAAATFTTNAPTWDVQITGYEY